MATKAELEAELSKLRAQNAKLKSETEQPVNETTQHDEASMTDEVRGLLKEHGVDTEKVEAMGSQLVDELTALRKDYPLTALIAAFALGYVVGRSRG